jgi:hypothetical protein
MKSLAWIQLFMNIGLLGVIFLIFGYALPDIDFNNFIFFNQENIFLPYGVIMFSLMGLNAVPEVAQILKKKKDLKGVVIVSIITAIFVYLLFAFSVVGVSGSNTSPDAFQGMVPYLGQRIIIIGSFLGMLAISTSFLILGNYLKNSLILDYNFKFFPAFLVTIFSPLALYLIGFREFIMVISFIGVFVGLIDGLVIILNYLKSRKMGDQEPDYSLNIPKQALSFIVLILVFGVLSQIIYHVIKPI